MDKQSQRCMCILHRLCLFIAKRIKKENPSRIFFVRYLTTPQSNLKGCQRTPVPRMGITQGEPFIISFCGLRYFYIPFRGRKNRCRMDKQSQSCMWILRRLCLFIAKNILKKEKLTKISFSTIYSITIYYCFLRSALFLHPKNYLVAR